jgi:hypothetical protein
MNKLTAAAIIIGTSAACAAPHSQGPNHALFQGVAAQLFPLIGDFYDGSIDWGDVSFSPGKSQA